MTVIMVVRNPHILWSRHLNEDLKREALEYMHIGQQLTVL